MRPARLAALGGAALLALSGCGSATSQVTLDGSSTVFLFSAIAAEDFQNANPGIQVKVGASGTGGGFSRFCRGETDANNASRAIKPEEAAECAAHDIEFGELIVAIDALTIVVNPENTWATCLTIDQLARMWEPGSTVTNWHELDPSFPDVPLKLFGPGTDSGTFDYFTSAINGAEGASRTDFTPSEDDNVIVQGVAGTKGGLGYFGFTYFEENADTLRAVEVDAGQGCIAPGATAAQDGTYALSRPLMIYPSVKALGVPHVREFFEFMVANDVSIAEGAGYIPLNADDRAKLETDLAALIAKAPAPAAITAPAATAEATS